MWDDPDAMPIELSVEVSELFTRELTRSEPIDRMLKGLFGQASAHRDLSIMQPIRRKLPPVAYCKSLFREQITVILGEKRFLPELHQLGASRFNLEVVEEQEVQLGGCGRASMLKTYREYIEETEELAMDGLRKNMHIFDVIVKELVQNSRVTGLEVEELMKHLSPVMFEDMTGTFMINWEQPPVDVESDAAKNALQKKQHCGRHAWDGHCLT
ncbi:hypothetical protein ACLOJK_020087 [Asimina triloba]